MRFKTKSGLFKEKAKLAARAAAGTTTLAVLRHILIAADADLGQIGLSATDLALGITTYFPAWVEEPGSITVPARFLVEYLETVTADDMIEVHSTEKLSLILACSGHKSGHKTTVRGGSPEEHVEFYTAAQLRGQGKIPVYVPMAAFLQLVAGTAFAAARDDTRPVLRGIFVDAGPDGLILSAADGYRLAIAQDPAALGDTIKAIVPAPALLLAASIADPEEERAALYLTDRRAIMDVGAGEVVTLLIEGNFPDVTQIVPEHYAVRLALERAPLIQALRAAGLFARDRANIVELTILADALEIFARSGAFGETRIHMPAEDVEGGTGWKIAFNCRYLIQALEASAANRVTLEFPEPTPTARLLIRDAEAPERWLSLQMPMALKGQGDA